MAFEERCPLSSLALNGLRFQVNLGCSEEERRHLQFVSFNVQLRFKILPRGCHSDLLEETVCFDQISQVIRTVCHLKSYHLIEKLGWDVFQALKKMLPPEIQLWVQTIKEKPPIPELTGGASFCVGDWTEL